MGVFFLKHGVQYLGEVDIFHTRVKNFFLFTTVQNRDFQSYDATVLPPFYGSQCSTVKGPYVLLYDVLTDIRQSTIGCCDWILYSFFNVKWPYPTVVVISLIVTVYAIYIIFMLYIMCTAYFWQYLFRAWHFAMIWWQNAFFYRLDILYFEWLVVSKNLVHGWF